MSRRKAIRRKRISSKANILFEVIADFFYFHLSTCEDSYVYSTDLSFSLESVLVEFSYSWVSKTGKGEDWDKKDKVFHKRNKEIEVG